MNLIGKQQQMTMEQWRAVVSADEASPTATWAHRREPRRNITLTSVQLTYRQEGKAAPVERPCTLLDVSAGGMMVRSRCSIAPETPLEIEVFWGDETSALQGTVQHCTPTVGAFKVGIRLHFAPTDSEDPHDEANTMEPYDEVEDHDSERDGSYGEASTTEHDRRGKKTSSSRVSPSYAIIGCLMLLATLAFILLIDGTPLTAAARPSERETELPASASLDF